MFILKDGVKKPDSNVDVNFNEPLSRKHATAYDMSLEEMGKLLRDNNCVFYEGETDEGRKSAVII